MTKPTVANGKAATPKMAAASVKVAAKPAESSSSNSSSEESSSDEAEVPRKAATAPNTPKNSTNGKRKKDEESSESEEEETDLKTPKNKKATTTPQTFPKVNKKSSNVPFRRIKEDEVNVDPRLADNSFDAKMGANGDWGQKANDVLRFTKGKSFRHEKTKKKRGSYRGGAISTSVNSIKFDSE